MIFICSSRNIIPSMMYSALNVRPNLLSEPSLHDSYWFIAIGYFNVILPSLFPASQDLAPTFWHRSREAKKQSTAAMKTPMLISRCRQMARERSERAQTFALQDDGKPVKPTQKSVSLFENASERPPSKALIGLSLLGNLDVMYKHTTYPGIRLHTLTTGSRQSLHRTWLAEVRVLNTLHSSRSDLVESCAVADVSVRHGNKLFSSRVGRGCSGYVRFITRCL